MLRKGHDCTYLSQVPIETKPMKHGYVKKILNHRNENKFSTVWAMHTWPGRWETIVMLMYGKRRGSWTHLRDVIIKHDRKNYANHYVLRVKRKSKCYCNKLGYGPYVQFNVSTFLWRVEDIFTKEENINQRNFIKGLSEYFSSIL